MIQIYSKSNRTFNTNGDKVLFPIVCMLNMELNGIWELELEHPVDDDGTWQFIEEEAVVAVPAPTSSKQLFRIYNVERTETSIQAYARPIFMDAAHEVFLADKRIFNSTGQEALNAMTSGTGYSGKSDIMTSAATNITSKNLLEAIAGEDESSFLNHWGGEILYDNHCIHVNKRIGGDYGISVRTGKNLIGIKETIDMDEVVTRIIPVAYKGYRLESSTPWVDSPYISRYAVTYTKEVQFDDVKLQADAEEDEKGFANLSELRKELVNRCKKMFAEGCDLPAMNYEVDLAVLEGTDEYKDVGALEKIGLGDTVKCRHRRLKISKSARVINMSYNCILKRAEKVTLGDFSYNYFKSITSSLRKIDHVTDENGNLRGQTIRGIIDANLTRLHAMAETAKRSGERAILFEDLDENSDTYGAMAIGTTGFLIAKEKTADNRDWKWETFGTAQGFHAEYLIAGFLSSRNWVKDQAGFQLDLDHGTINSKYLKMNNAGIVSMNKAEIEGGRITNYSSTGRKAIEIQGTNLRFYDWKGNSDIVGGASSTVTMDDDKETVKRSGISYWCDKGDYLSIGYSDGDSIIRVISVDPNEDFKLRISGTASGKLFSHLATGGIEVKNGLITDWGMMGDNGSVETSQWKLDIVDGIITKITNK